MTTTSAPPPAPDKQDPIRERYFKRLNNIESLSTWLFYGTAIVSLFPVALDKQDHRPLFEAAQIAFIVLVVALFFVGLAGRLWAMSPAHDARRKDLVSNAYSVPLTHERTEGYYNNNQTDPVRRLGVSTMESAYFTYSVLDSIAWKRRATALVYVLLFVSMVLYRGIPYEALGVAAQVVFGEEVIARHARFEWLLSRSKEVYERLYALFQSSPNKANIHARAVVWFARYEASKDNAAVPIPEREFKRMKPSLDQGWEKIRGELGL